MYLAILRRLRDAVRKKRPQKSENQDLVSPSPQCSSTPVGFGQGVLSKDMEYPQHALNLAAAAFYCSLD